MHSGFLALLLLATGGAAWSAAADVGVMPGDRPLQLTIDAPVASSLPGAGQGCLGATRERIVLRAPKVDPTGLPAADVARIELAVLEDWQSHMTAAGVPRDLLDRTVRMPNRLYELSSHDMDRVGCVAV